MGKLLFFVIFLVVPVSAVRADSADAQSVERAQRGALTVHAFKHAVDANKRVVADASTAAQQRLQAMSNLSDLLLKLDDAKLDEPKVVAMRTETLAFVASYLDPRLGGRRLSHAAADVLDKVWKHSVPMVLGYMGNDWLSSFSGGHWCLVVNKRPFMIRDHIVQRRLVLAMKKFAAHQSSDRPSDKELLELLAVVGKTIVMTGDVVSIYPVVVRSDALDILLSMTVAERGERRISNVESMLSVNAALHAIAANGSSGGSFQLAAAAAIADEVLVASEHEQAVLVTYLHTLASSSPDRSIRRMAVNGLSRLAATERILVYPGSRNSVLLAMFDLLADSDASVRRVAGVSISYMALAQLTAEERAFFQNRLIRELEYTAFPDVRPVLLSAVANLAESALSQVGVAEGETEDVTAVGAVVGLVARAVGAVAEAVRDAGVDAQPSPRQTPAARNVTGSEAAKSQLIPFFATTDALTASQSSLTASGRYRASQLLVARSLATDGPAVHSGGLRIPRSNSDATPRLPPNQYPGLRRFASMSPSDYPQNQRAGLRKMRQIGEDVAGAPVNIPDISFSGIPSDRRGAIGARGATRNIPRMSR